MTARPLLFSGPMIRAPLEGRKTQTRRVMKAFQVPKLGADGMWFAVAQKHSRWGFGVSGQSEQECARELAAWGCPYGKPGDLLWVRETWAGHKLDAGGSVNCYRASHNKDHPPEWCGSGKWTPSIHMPRWASRLTLEITGVRVERLQDISEADKAAEGGSPDRPFGTVWKAINTKPGIRWEDNPFVWVIEFQVHKQNVDAVLKARVA